MAQAMVTSSTTLGGELRYNIPGVTLMRSVAVANVATTAYGTSRSTGQIYYMPIRVYDPINITEVGIYVTVAAGAAETGIIGIYSADANMEPDGSPVPGSPIDFLIDATGPVASDALDIDLDRGTYLVSWQCSANVTLRYVTGLTPDTIGFDPDWFGPIVGKIQATRSWDGTNPDPGTTPAAFSQSEGNPSGDAGFDYIFGMEYTIL